MNQHLKKIITSDYFRQKAAVYLITAIICAIVLIIAFKTQGGLQPE